MPAAASARTSASTRSGLVEAVGAVAERVHGPDTALADVARAVRRARVERRAVVLMLPLDVQAAPCPDGAPPVADGPALGAAAARRIRRDGAGRPARAGAAPGHHRRARRRARGRRRAAARARRAAPARCWPRAPWPTGCSPATRSTSASPAASRRRWPRGCWGRPTWSSPSAPALNQWTTGHGTLPAPDARRRPGRPRRGGDRRTPARGAGGDRRRRGDGARRCWPSSTRRGVDRAARRTPALAERDRRTALARRALRRGRDGRGPRSAHAEHRARRPVADRAHRRGGLRRLHGLAVDVPARPRRGRLRLPAGLPVRRPRPGQRHRGGDRPPRPPDGGGARRRRRAAVAARVRDARAPAPADPRRHLQRRGLRRRGPPLRPDGRGRRPRAVPRHRLRRARAGGRLPRRHGAHARRPRRPARVARRAATARSCSTRRSTPRSTANGSRKPSDTDRGDVPMPCSPISSTPCSPGPPASSTSPSRSASARPCSCCPSRSPTRRA